VNGLFFTAAKLEAIEREHRISPHAVLIERPDFEALAAELRRGWEMADAYHALAVASGIRRP
jgi:hypothetical protein